MLLLTICCGSSFQSCGPAYLIELLHACARLPHGIGSFPWVFDLKFFLVRLRSSKLHVITNGGAIQLTHCNQNFELNMLWNVQSSSPALILLMQNDP